MTSTSELGSLSALDFKNRFTRELPADSSEVNHPREVRHACYTRVKPTPARDPSLVAHSREVGELLGLSESACLSPEFTEVFAGSRVLTGMDCHANCYGGHQFGHWAGQLGDGRAINLGEVLAPNGEYFTLQLKGAGPTPYSRTADGYAVLRSSVREFLCSEAMFHLGVPTTRALSLIRSGQGVLRDMFYDGNAKSEPGAVVCRVARSFTRFGSFEILAARRENELLKQLADHTIRTEFPTLAPPLAEIEIAHETYVEWFREISRLTAVMVVDWMRVGFVHGVMNTDNMSIIGDTIDYGPYGWLEDFDPGWTPNTTDATGRRYAYGQQPEIAYWNLVRLANALVPLLPSPELMQDALDVYPELYETSWKQTIAAKLGWCAFRQETDGELVAGLMQLLPKLEIDMTIFYRQLATLPAEVAEGESASDESILQTFAPALYESERRTPEALAQLVSWCREYTARVRLDEGSDSERRERMNAVNPRCVLRNYLAQQAIEKAEAGDDSGVTELLEVLRRPYDEQPERVAFAARRPEWARNKPGCSALSCSS